MNLDYYTETFEYELREFVALWSQPEGGVDRAHGGFCCGLDYSGARLVGNKYVWFQGRGLWVWSCLSHRPAARAALGVAMPSAELLGVASAAKDFVDQHGRDDDGGWIVETDAAGTTVLRGAEPRMIATSGYGSAFFAEGLVEWAVAVAATAEGDVERVANATAALRRAHAILADFVALADDATRPGDLGWPNVYAGMRSLGHHMIALNLTRQLLEASSDARLAVAAEPALGADAIAALEALAARMVDAVMVKFHHAEFDLICEILDHSYERPADANEDLCYLGHAIETLWMVMAEARRRWRRAGDGAGDGRAGDGAAGDGAAVESPRAETTAEAEALFALAALRFRRHVEVAADRVYGGTLRGVHVRTQGYLLDGDAKVKWAHDEVLIGCLLIVEHAALLERVASLLEAAPCAAAPRAAPATAATHVWRRALAVAAVGELVVCAGGGASALRALSTWARVQFAETQRYVAAHFSLKHFGYARGWRVGGDRLVAPVPPAVYNMGCKTLPNRMEHYHHPRHLVLCLESLAAIARQEEAQEEARGGGPVPSNLLVE